MHETDDRELLDRLAQGREEAYAEVYDRFGPGMFKAAWAILGKAWDAEDAVEEVFVALVRGREHLPGVRDLRAYLMTSVRRAAGRIGSARRPEADSPLVEASEPTPAPAPPDRELFEQAVRSLPSEQREVLALKAYGGLTFAEIGETLGVSANTAASRYRYALDHVRKECRL